MHNALVTVHVSDVFLSIVLMCVTCVLSPAVQETQG